MQVDGAIRLAPARRLCQGKRVQESGPDLGRSCLFVGDHTPSPDGQDGWVPKETWKFFSQF